MTSLWLERHPLTSEDGNTFPASDFGPDASYDVVVVGAGLTGLVTGLLLARAGKHVAIVESLRVGGLTTGNTTAKLSLLQGAKYSEMLKHTAAKNARAYVDSNREGFEWLIRYLDDHDVAYQRRAAYSYAGTPEGAATVDEEVLAASRLGLPVQKVRDLDVPFPTYGAVRLDDQAQFDPLDVLEAMAADFRARGGTIVEGVRVTGVRALSTGPGKPAIVATTAGNVRAEKVVLATGIPILDRGLYFSKVIPSRSYALSFRIPETAVPEDFGMFITVDAPTRTLRTIPGHPADAHPDGRFLLVGGNDHVVGQHPHPKDLVTDLVTWTHSYYPEAELTHTWAAQDYKSDNLIPFVGWLPRGGGKVYVATGFDKWGMTNGVAAGIRLSATILGGHLPWAETMGHRMTRPRSLLLGAAAGADVGKQATTGWVGGLTAPSAESAPPPAEGQGEIRRAGVRPVGVCTVAGVTSTVSAVCPHLGGIVNWNDQELSWDCPLHGSRFRADGTRIEGPTTSDLKPV